MDFSIKVRQTNFSRFIKFFIVLLMITSAVFYTLGFIDFRTEEQKKADEIEKILSRPYAEETIEAIRYVYFEYNTNVTIHYVTHLRQKGYVHINIDSATKKDFDIYYDLRNNKKITETTWVSAMGNILSNNLFFGNSNSSSTYTVEGEELELLIQVMVDGVN